MPKPVLGDAKARPRLVASAALAAGLLLSCWGAGCSSQDDRVGFVGSFEQEAGSLTPSTGDAGTADATVDAEVCTATECPAPYATCGNSTFRCDKNLDNDNLNCGGCGIRCPGGDDSSIEGVLHADWRCGSGACNMSCSQGFVDCNANPGDGCEVSVYCDPNNCGGCGIKCGDGVQCILGRCGCAAGLTQCGDADCTFDDYKICKDTTRDELNCGGCGIPCPKLTTLPPHMINGCQDSECGHPKCESGWEDCDGNKDNGCEVETGSDQKNCGACGFICNDNQRCQAGECLCPPGAQACPYSATGDDIFCAYVDTDPYNCGVCGRQCPFVPDGFGKATCSDGRCRLGCEAGTADCDGNWTTGCETATDSDPNNCGGCGIQCDVAEGQPCIRGVCAVQPCEQGPVQ